MEIVLLSKDDEVQATRELFREYQRHIGVDLCFQGFEAELESLPGDYGPPSGRLLLAKSGDQLAGCVALRRLPNSACEMKRLFVRPEFQGQGIGRKLATTIIAVARSIGYTTMRLDTLPTMKEATALYVALGFQPIPTYNASPIAGTLYFELDLH